MPMKTEEYVRAMRKHLCKGEVCDAEGNLNHEYFQSKKNSYWGEAQHKALVDGLAKYEVGDWEKFKKASALESFYDVELELRTCLLLDVKSIAAFSGRRLTADELKVITGARK